MKSNSRMHLSNVLNIAAAGALAFGLAACDMKPAADSPGKTFDNLVENAGRTAGPAFPAAEAQGVKSSGMGNDAALAAKVRAALSSDPGLRSLTVDVNATDGIVTLYGTADTPAKSHLAAMVALNVDGVRSVKNEMVVVRGS